MEVKKARCQTTPFQGGSKRCSKFILWKRYTRGDTENHKPKGHEVLLRGLKRSLLKKKNFTLIQETFGVFFMGHNVFHLFLSLSLFN